jgi:hypothetical protein
MKLEAIKQLGGTTIRINRGPKPDWYDDAIAVNSGPRHISWALSTDRLHKLKIHPSEYSSVGLKYDHEIDNDGTIDELHQKVKLLINL